VRHAAKIAVTKSSEQNSRGGKPLKSSKNKTVAKNAAKQNSIKNIQLKAMKNTASILQSMP
jgi:hypothetical protein